MEFRVVDDPLLAVCEAHLRRWLRDVPAASYGHILDSGLVLTASHARQVRPVPVDRPEADITSTVTKIGVSSLSLRLDVAVEGATAALVTITIARVRDGVPQAFEPSEREWFARQPGSPRDVLELSYFPTSPRHDGHDGACPRRR